MLPPCTDVHDARVPHTIYAQWYGVQASDGRGGEEESRHYVVRLAVGIRRLAWPVTTHSGSNTTNMLEDADA